jgi:hypothetical protein
MQIDYNGLPVGEGALALPFFGPCVGRATMPEHGTNSKEPNIPNERRTLTEN